MSHPSVTNSKGGVQSDIGVRYDLIPTDVLRLVAETLAHGDKKYGPANIKKLLPDENYNHCLDHMDKARNGEDVRKNVAHAVTRAIMWGASVLAEMSCSDREEHLRNLRNDEGWQDFKALHDE